ncbi:hypothetical protein C0033_09550 [Clostridium sp. chh4-2]|nr:hypothetical protein C0033_09550 [Clostridium sp. chh4-2]
MGMSKKSIGKKAAAGVLVAVVLAAGIAAGVKIAGSLDFSGEEYHLKRTPLVENYEAGSDEEEGVFQGTVVGEDGKPVEGAWVAVGIKGEAKPFVKMETDEKGAYSWKVEDEEEQYYLVFQKEDCITVVMEPDEKDSTPYNLQDAVVLLDKEEDKDAVYPVSVKGLAVLAKEMGEDQDIKLEEDGWSAEEEQSLPGLEGAQVDIRRGINCTDGDAEVSLKIGDDGTASADLAKGTYTAVITKEGFNPVTFILYAKDEEPEITVPCVERSAGGWQIVLTWEGEGEPPLDLDSMAVCKGRLISSLNRGDEAHGRYLFDSYGKTGCEVIEMPEEAKDYQYYVMDYNRVIEGKSSSLEDSGAAVWVYHNGNLKERYQLPTDETQPIWNPFAVKDGSLVTAQAGLDSIEGVEGWKADKVLSRMNSKDLNAGVIVSDGEWLYFTNQFDENKLYYIKKDGTGMGKLCDDPTGGHSRKILDGSWIYYCIEGENGRGKAVYRIKTDGSGREQVKTLNEGQWLSLLGKADGRLFVWNQDKIGGEISYIDDNGIETSLGTGLSNQISLVGHSLYYLNEAGYGGTAKGLHCRNLKTGEDNLIIPDVDWFQFYIRDGYFYHDEGLSLFRMQLGKEPEFIASGQEARIGSFIMYEDWIFYYDDGSVYRTNLDGTDKICIKNTVGQYEIIDGELYTDRGKFAPIKVCGLNGENERDLFDVLPYKKDAAAQAYYQFLCENESNGDPDWPSYSRFASLDVNGDGVNELFYSINEYSMQTDRLYSFEDDMVLAKTLADGYKYGGTVVYEEDVKMLTAIYRYGEMGSPDEVTLYSTENVYPRILDSGYRYSIGWDDDTLESQENAARFDAILADHWVGKQSVNWVENTEENRKTYILGGQSTGYGDVMEAWQ